MGSKGINIMGFCKEFNARTQDKAGKVLPVVITYYTDKSYSFEIKTSPAAVQLLEAAKVKGGFCYLGSGKSYCRGQDGRPQLFHSGECHEVGCRNCT